MNTIMYHSGCGDLLLGEADGRLCLCAWASAGQGRGWEARTGRHVAEMTGCSHRAETPTLRMACAQLDAYFAGQRRVFDMPLRLGGTPFQISVWREVCRVGYGDAVTYGALAARLGRAGAARAVAAALAANPVAIFVPCHRVVAAGGMGGYAGGAEAKRHLRGLAARHGR